MSWPADGSITRRLSLLPLVFWVVTPCGFVRGYRHLGGMYRLHLHGRGQLLRWVALNGPLSTLRTEAARFSEHNGNHTEGYHSATSPLCVCSFRVRRGVSCTASIDVSIIEMRFNFAFSASLSRSALLCDSRVQMLHKSWCRGHGSNYRWRL